jgi:hypothetical protein
MSDQYRHYIIVLDDLRSRRAEYQRAVTESDQAIAAMERILREIQGSTHSDMGERRADPASNTFAGMTLGDAAAAFIRSVGREQTTREIVNGLQSGGVSTNSKNLFTTMYNVLSKRAERENSDIVKSGTGWTLREFQNQ